MRKKRTRQTRFFKKVAFWYILLNFIFLVDFLNVSAGFLLVPWCLSFLIHVISSFVFLNFFTSIS